MERKDTVFIFIIAALLVTLFFVSKRAQQATDLESAIAEKNSDIEYHVNNESRLIAERKAAEITADDIKKFYPAIQAALKDELDVKTKDLKAYIKSEIRAAGSGDAGITNNYYTTPDGKRKEYPTFSVDDGYLSLKMDWLDSLHAPYSYSYTDTIKQTISVKKKWFLGKEQLYGSATLSNPNAKVTGSESVLIRDYKDKRFGLGFGVLYDPFVNQVRIGIGLQYNLIRF